MRVGCVSFWNDAWILERCLRELKKRVDRIIAVDGVYEHFPHDGHASTDGSIQIATRYADVIIVHAKEHYADEMAKRNVYIEEANVGDWLIVVDADEVMHGALPQLDGRAYRIHLHDRGDRRNSMQLMRVFKKTKRMHYQGAHFAVFDGARLLNNGEIPTIPKEVVALEHYRLKRPRTRSVLKGEYVEHLKISEREFRAKWCPQT